MWEYKVCRYSIFADSDSEELQVFLITKYRNSYEEELGNKGDGVKVVFEWINVEEHDVVQHRTQSTNLGSGRTLQLG